MGVRESSGSSSQDLRSLKQQVGHHSELGPHGFHICLETCKDKQAYTAVLIRGVVFWKTIL